MKLIALIDGGGTKTRVRFLNQADQTVISEVVTGPSNLGLGADVCLKQIMQAIALAGVPMPVRYVAGLAGSEYIEQRSAFLSNAPCETLLVSDRDSGLFGAHCGMPGGCLTVGTGVALRGGRIGSFLDGALVLCWRPVAALGLGCAFYRNWFGLLIEA